MELLWRAVLRGVGGMVPTLPDVQHASSRFLVWGLGPPSANPHMPCAPSTLDPCQSPDAAPHLFFLALCLCCCRFLYLNVPPSTETLSAPGVNEHSASTDALVRHSRVFEKEESPGKHDGPWKKQAESQKRCNTLYVN